MKKIIFLLAALGLILGLIVHIVSILGIYIGDSIPFIWVLHLAIFIVWLPTILELRKNKEFMAADAKSKRNPLKFFQMMFKNAPAPVMYLTMFFFIYSFINFFIFMQIEMNGVPDIIDGQYVINNHGSIIKMLTEAEFYKIKANELRGYSGHWLLFYGIAMGVLWPEKEKNETI